MRLGTVEYIAPPPPPRGHAGRVYSGGRRRGRRLCDPRPDGMERRMVAAIAECPRCGEDVALWDDTGERILRRGRWEHEGYSGCAQGVCCGLLLVDSWDGACAYDLEAQDPGEPHDEEGPCLHGVERDACDICNSLDEDDWQAAPAAPQGDEP